MVQSAGQPLSGEVRMSVIPTIAPFLLPRMLPRLRRERPALKLYLREETSAAASQVLGASRELAVQADTMKQEVDRFLQGVRAA